MLTDRSPGWWIFKSRVGVWPRSLANHRISSCNSARLHHPQMLDILTRWVHALTLVGAAKTTDLMLGNKSSSKYRKSVSTPSWVISVSLKECTYGAILLERRDPRDERRSLQASPSKLLTSTTCWLYFGWTAWSTCTLLLIWRYRKRRRMITPGGKECLSITCLSFLRGTSKKCGRAWWSVHACAWADVASSI